MKIGLNYADMLARNLALRAKVSGQEYRVALLANITNAPLASFLEHILLSLGVNAQVSTGNFDNIVQDSERFSDHDLIVVFWEVCNLVDGLQYKAELMDEATRAELIETTKQALNILVRNLAGTSLVLMNRFSTLPFTAGRVEESGLETISRLLNEHLANIAPRSFRLVDLDRVISKVSVSQSVSWRDFYAGKALYSLDFYRAYTEHVAPLLYAALGNGRKALVFDCDNTLWKGVVGEDGFDHIEISPAFREVQTLALVLRKQGVLLGLCSKNNPEDVEAVLESHPDMLLRSSDFSIKVVNWSDKAENLLRVAQGLNIGLDAVVFVDDSDFEVNLLRKTLPDVHVIQVPRRLHDYPAVIREAFGLFTSLGRTAEDANRARMYLENRERDMQRQEFGRVEDYLRSLDLKVNVIENDISAVPRLAQLTQKTNQFNLTTRRYTEADIERMTRDGRHRVIAFSVADRFGPSGITGLCIVSLTSSREAEVDILLMSCRVIGRNLELAFFDFLVARLAQAGIQLLRGSYRKTEKNSQVSEFYNKLGFSLLAVSERQKDYVLKLSEYVPANIDYIEVSHGRRSDQKDTGGSAAYAVRRHH